ncbi:ATP-grasp domain-containing protein [Apibacter sp. HY039]|uniref:ATP-grasp domain-containing protein n=1 Tax=Apibacter sp. HY039 TaxID=2501476 RepID=UPI0021025D69|nr:ATP-grasp domain-containing protein [Apibacter sp. HY039]
MKTAVLYQFSSPPEKNGIIKPLKKGGYADSGADIAYALKINKIPVITPVNFANPRIDLDWVFPDTFTGIAEAIDLGAEVLWLNTVLYQGHPIEDFLKSVKVVGQLPEIVDKYDDKYLTNLWLKKYDFPIPYSHLLNRNFNKEDIPSELNYPVILKPVRGRGSQGVTKIDTKEELWETASSLFKSGIYGDYMYLEEFLSGEELTITVMPPGSYIIENQKLDLPNYWSLPPVKRFNHEKGVAPYNGVVAVMSNSKILTKGEIQEPKIQMLCKQCEKAAELIEARAPIRVDCRANKNGNYFLFDVNLKPNMTGAGRPNREEQDSLTMLAAKGIGWTYPDLLINMLNQCW